MQTLTFFLLTLLTFPQVAFAEQTTPPLWHDFLTMPPERTPKPSYGGYLLGDSMTKQQRKEIKEALEKRKEVLRVASFNILFHFMDDQLPPQHRWPARLPRVIATIRTLQPDIIGLQETQIDQMEDLKRELDDEYTFLSVLGALRAVDPKNRFVDGILFRKKRFQLLEEGFRYHTQTPKVPSIHKEAGFPTVNHYAILKDRISGKTFAFTNCHLYFFSAEIRELAIDALGQFMNEYPDLPMIFVGDLNLTTPLRDLNPTFLDGHHMLRHLKALGWRDALEESLLGHIGPLSTYTTSPEQPHKPFSGTGIPGKRLDRIFITSRVLPLLHGIYANTFDGNYASDHFPVVADIIIQQKP